MSRDGHAAEGMNESLRAICCSVACAGYRSAWELHMVPFRSDDSLGWA